MRHPYIFCLALALPVLFATTIYARFGESYKQSFKRYKAAGYSVTKHPNCGAYLPKSYIIHKEWVDLSLEDDPPDRIAAASIYWWDKEFKTEKPSDVVNIEQDFYKKIPLRTYDKLVTNALPCVRITYGFRIAKALDLEFIVGFFEKVTGTKEAEWILEVVPGDSNNFDDEWLGFDRFSLGGRFDRSKTFVWSGSSDETKGLQVFYSEGRVMIMNYDACVEMWLNGQKKIDDAKRAKVSDLEGTGL